jgi:hypothetical protein
VPGYIALYGGARRRVQLSYFDRSATPPGVLYKLAEVALVVLFLGWTVIYGVVALS